MQPLATGISFVDLEFQGRPRVIACVVLHDTSGIALLDPGPASTLPALTRQLAAAGIGMEDVTTILLTHVHLDHAGAVGTLVRQHPRLRVYVHESGVRHLVDPSKLVASATRLYGDAMERLWGEVAPVPGDTVVSLSGGERIRAGGRHLDVAYTPGHASHHVSYFSDDTGIAFVGDTAGVQVVPNGFVLPPTPPPDIDLELWSASLMAIERWRPGTLFLTHFGPGGPPTAHIGELRDNLDQLVSLARESLTREGDDAAQEAWFIERVRERLQRRAADVATYEIAGRFDLNWRGLARYLRKRSPA
jgi:glyoxylase-like metal-dependent hydrolase (beta-lactamase superfamily II)